MIEEGAKLADGVQIGAGCYVGRNVSIGADTKLYAYFPSQNAALDYEEAGFEVGLVPGLGAPCVAGLVRPRIYCPADLAERLDAGELRAVLIHERHHQRTHAPARLILLAAIAPVGRVGMCGSWLEGRRAAIEIAADVHALDAGAGRPELARALFKLGSASLAPGLPSYTSASELRLRHLVGETSPSRRGLGSLVPFVLPVVAFGACVAWGLVA